MSRIALDSIEYANMAGLNWPHLIGYANGRISAWSADDIAAARSRGQLLALVDVLGTAPHQASVLDFERGDVQSPAVVRAWVQARNQFAGDATVYVSPRQMLAAVSGLRGEPCNLLVVDLTADGEPPFGLPHYPGLPANVRVIGRQFVFGPRSGGAYDMSVIYADDWHPDQQHPAHYAPVRLAAAAELGRLAWAANVPVEPDPNPAPVAITTTAELGDVADQAAAAPVPVGVGAASISSLAPVSLGLATVAADVGLPPPAAALGAPNPSPSTRAAASTPGGEPGKSHAADVDQAAELADVDQAAAGSEAAPAAAAQSPLNHEFIRRVLVDVGTVAEQLHAGGWHHAATELERAAGLAWEIGSALKSAGL